MRGFQINRGRHGGFRIASKKLAELRKLRQAPPLKGWAICSEGGVSGIMGGGLHAGRAARSHPADDLAHGDRQHYRKGLSNSRATFLVGRLRRRREAAALKKNGEATIIRQAKSDYQQGTFPRSGSGPIARR